MLRVSSLGSNIGSQSTVTPPLSHPNGTGPSTIRPESQECTLENNKAGYLKIYSYGKKGGKDNVVCFSGTGSLDYSISNVKRIETGKYRASWVYVNVDGKSHRSPTSLDQNVYWCPGQERIYVYNNFTQVKKIILAPATVKCVDSDQ